MSSKPVRHFYIDFRNMLLKPKLEKIANRGWQLEKHHRQFDVIPGDELYSEFDVSRVLDALNSVYGKEIEYQVEVMHCIDSLF